MDGEDGWAGKEKEYKRKISEEDEGGGGGGEEEEGGGHTQSRSHDLHGL